VCGRRRERWRKLGRERGRDRENEGARERESESVRETVPFSCFGPPIKVVLNFLFTRENRKFKTTLIGGPKQEFIIGSPMFLLSPMSELDGQFLF
jgi:hypothetical protein